MAKQVSITPEEKFARDYADRLILSQISELQSVIKLSEISDRLADQGIGLAAVRSLLASNPDRFAYAERRWVPTSRIAAANRPIIEQVRLVVHNYGGPLKLSLVLNEINITRPGTTEALLRRVIEGSPIVALTADDQIFLRDWVFSSTDHTTAFALNVHGIDPTAFEELKGKLSKFNFREAGSVAKALAEVAPVNVILFGAAVWNQVNPQNPTATLFYDWKRVGAEIFGMEGLVYNTDGKIYPVAETKKWLSNAVKLADKLAPTVDVEDAQPIEVTQDQVDKMVAKIVGSESSITATRLLEEFYEITPSVKTFPDDIANVIDALRARNEVMWVGGDRFNKKGIVPELVESIPDLFQYVPTAFTDEEDEFVDVELTDDGLTSTLRKLLNHPLATDVLDEDIMPATKQQPETVRCVLKSIHRELGTFPMSQIPTGWLDEKPDFQELILIDRDGRELQIWANTRDRLMFGFIDWFYEQNVESGAVFSLTKTPRTNVLEFEWLDQTDPVVFITEQRMNELREIQERSETMSTYDVLREVMTHWPKGADFLTLLWEVNVVRRSSRRLIASLLSSYACFYQRSGSPVWHYDAKKVEAGFDKSKRKFIKK